VRKKTIPVGVENFAMIREKDSYYVDKTELIYELVHDTDNAVTLFTRPRRFGKTLTMSMLDTFFNIHRRDGEKLFEGLDISKHSEFCREYMNQYPVIFLSLKDTDGLNFKSAFEMLRAAIADFCKRLVISDKFEPVDPDDKKIFAKLKAEEGTVSDIKNSLKNLMRMMYSVYGKQVILLIDEYDVPLAKAHHNGYYSQMIDLVRGLMSTSLKTNPYLKFAVITGCLRIPKESIFTGVNNFASYSVMDEYFSDYFGFTQNEVEDILEYYELSDKMKTAKEWYDGYLFGTSEIYCPWDVIYFVRDLLKNPNRKPKNYWENTSSNSEISSFFDIPDCDPSDKFEVLLNGGSISENITDALTYTQIHDSESNLWSVLLMTGYLTPVYPDHDDSGLTELRIPNREIASIFKTAVVEQFNKTLSETQITDMMNALWNGNEELASEIISDILWHTISYFNYSEDFYQAFLAGIFRGRSGGNEIKTDDEQGIGRSDIDYRDKRNRRAMIIETKCSDSKKDMERDCEKAIVQIKEKEYAKDLDGYKKVMRYGISFYKKQAMVKLDRSEESEI